jgi:putative mRNA 3-end processing factor
MPSENSVTLAHCGIMASYKDIRIALDPSYLVDCDFAFVSHAHTDHLHRARKNSAFKGQILASKETCAIARTRGYTIREPIERHDTFELVDTGHIVGSKGLLVGGEIYYTGDISTRKRAFMKPAQLPKVKVLVIESTFGRPDYVFPELAQIVHETNRIISEMYDLGKPVILMGYPLGKAQVLTSLFGHWDPIYVHDSVWKMNSVCIELGIELKQAITFSEAEKRGLLDSRPWLMISPLMHGRNEFVGKMKRKYGAITIGFSGWATGRRYASMMGLDYAMPMSDHCDFKELVAAVKSCSPDKVYTFHGFAADFAKYLRSVGFDAEPLGAWAENNAEKDGKQEGRTLTLDVFS